MLLKLADTVLILINACVHVKLEIHLFVMNFNSTGFSLLCGGYWLWACRISLGLQTCIAERSKVPNG